MVLCPNTVIFAARIDGAPSGESFAEITYDTVTTGAYTDIENGQTVLIASTNDKKLAYHAGYIRKTPTSTIIYIDETRANIADGDYLFVISDYRIWERKARESSGVYYKNFDATFAELDPIITNLRTAYVDIASGSPEVYSQQFVATAIAGTSGASISSYAYTIDSGMAVTAGSASTNDVTIEFDVGTYWLKLVVTDSGGRTATRRIFVASVPSDFSSVVSTGFTGAQIEGTVDDGFNASVTAFDGVSAVLDNTFCVVFDREVYNGSVDVIDHNIRFVGRLRTETNVAQTDPVASLDREVRFNLEGIGDQLGRVPTQPITAIHDTTPTVWDQINNATHWRFIAHILQTHSTALTLCALAFDDTSNDSLFNIWGMDGADLLTEINVAAGDWVSGFEMAPDGRLEINQRATQLDSSGRTALTTVAAWVNQDFVGDIQLERGHVKETGQVLSGGGSYQTGADTVAEYLSEAPGPAPDPYPGRFPLEGQVLTANSNASSAAAELNTRTGHALAEENPADELIVTLPDGYGWLIPSRALWYTWTLTEADLDLRGISYTSSDRWLLVSISTTHDNDTGMKQVSATFRLETTGYAGITKPPPTVVSSTYILPTIPPFPPYPAFPVLPDLITFPGDTFEPPPFWGDVGGPGELPDTIENVRTKSVFFGTGEGATTAGAWTSQNFVDGAPSVYQEVTPSLPTGHDVMHGVLGFGTEAYLLSSDGTTSYCWYTSNVWIPDRIWVQNNALFGKFEIIRLGSTQGEVWLYANAGGNEPVDIEGDYWLTPEFSVSYSKTTTSNFGEQVLITLDTSYAGAVGILLDWSGTVSGGGGNLSVNTDGDEFSQPDTFLFSGGTGSYGGASIFINPWSEASVFPTYTADPGPFAPNLTTLRARTTLRLNAGGNYDTGGTLTFEGTARIIIKTSVQAFPGASTGDSMTVYSTNSAAAFAAAELIGTGPDDANGSIDTAKIGTRALAASDGQAELANTGGAWADYGSAMPTSTEATAILIPRLKFTDGASNASTATPEYLTGSGALDASNEALWAVTASGATFTDITPFFSPDYGLATGPDCLAMSWRSEDNIAAVLLYGSLPKLVVSANQGSSWTDRGVLTADANAVTFRKGDADMVELYGTDGHPWFTLDNGAVITKLTSPTDASNSPITWIDVYG